MTSTRTTPRPDLTEGVAALEAVYKAYAQGGELTLEAWQQAQAGLELVAKAAVRRCSGRHKVPPHTRASLEAEVFSELTEKFVRKSLNARTNFEAFMRTVGFRASITVLRKIRSPLAGAIMNQDGAAGAAPEIGASDVFEHIRGRLGVFRFRQYPFARETILAHLLSTRFYPDPEVLAMTVPLQDRMAVYNAAIVSINVAAAAVLHEDQS